MESVSGPIVLASIVTVLGIVGCFVSDTTGRRIFEYVGKPSASLAFLGLGFYTAGATESPVVTAFLAALGFSLLGDVALMGRTNVTFLGGLTAFLLGHVAFVVAFVLRGLAPWYVIGSLPLLVVVAVPVGRWLLPYVPDKMKGPVMAYMAVISAMVVCAIGTHGYAPAPELVVAAVMFFVSDLAVARQQFVEPHGWNRYWGLPLYFGAQLVFAAHILA